MKSWRPQNSREFVILFNSMGEVAIAATLKQNAKAGTEGKT
jgi:hypothetical protein